MMSFRVSLNFDEVTVPTLRQDLVKPTMRKVGSEVQKIAKKLVAKRAVSKEGEFPGRQSGTLQKGIKIRLSKTGWTVNVNGYANNQIKPFYPAFVVYGHRAPGTDSKKQRGKIRVGVKVAKPRKNYIIEAASVYANTKFRPTIEQLFKDSIQAKTS